MKYSVTIAAIALLVISCYKKPEEVNELPVRKNVQFRVAQANDYSLPIYDGLRAEVKLSVAKESAVNGTILAVWDTTMVIRDIRSYPTNNIPLIITKHITDVWQSREVLRVSSVIRYVNANNQIVQNAVGEAIPAQVTLKEVAVNL